MSNVESGMSSLRKVSNLLQSLTGKAKPNPVNLVAQRFIRAFGDHGVEVAQIPRLMPGVTLDALKSEEALVAILSPEVLDRTAQLFGIRSQWLEGVDDRIYEYLACYKEPNILLDHLADLVRGKDIGLTFPLRALTTTRQLDRNLGGPTYLAPILLEKIATIGEEPIYRYHIYQDGFDWSHFPARIQLKAIVQIGLDRLSMVVPLHVISEREMDEVLEGRMIPRLLLDGCQITNPSLEDYVLGRAKSQVAKEEEELPDVLEYIVEHNLQFYKFGPSEPLSLVPEEKAGGSKVEEASKGEAPNTIEEAAKPLGWRDAARAIADELDAKDEICGAHDSLTGLSVRVAKEMRERKIHGPRGPLTAGTILREALQGGRWKPKRKR